MIRNLLVICFCFFAIVTASGQSVFSGRVLEHKTRIPLVSVRIQNLSNGLKTISLKDGQFAIAAKTGDLIVFNTFSYQPDTVLITDMHAREIFMEPKSTMLNQVTITDTSGRAKANANAVQHYDPDFHGQTVVYQRDAKGYYKGGIAIRLHYWTKDDHKKCKAAQSAKEREISEQISSVFTAMNIGNYVPLKGEDLDNFLLLYTPDVKEYTDKRFELVPYLNACYVNWQTLTPEQRKAGDIFGK
ncbi:peptidase associated/transthyretin-like domain-containing protein [Mucilaginibacter xinganensis]|uniref:CarboxypepD_reg-like domain-containing protein n=1 Tax=Mucilaginibacter xinganensis TaxID=1234841 RepID=A0A223NU55_9SPHI|nr:hypothetical protein [Mucilaginibacter xinganensis]ASU33403.1 hypothetical protein MuYL_1505 [Mucilaginibacter xinganensis]